MNQTCSFRGSKSRNKVESWLDCFHLSIVIWRVRFSCWSLSSRAIGAQSDLLQKNKYWRLNASRPLREFIISLAYATLLNCWKFLKLFPTKSSGAIRSSMALVWINILFAKGMVRTERDVTMDNQQPSSIIRNMNAVHRLRWQWVIGGDTLDCLRYSRADALRKCIRLEIKNKSTQINSPFRRWTCGRIITTFQTYQPIVNNFQISHHREWAESHECECGIYGSASAKQLIVRKDYRRLYFCGLAILTTLVSDTDRWVVGSY